MKQISYIYNYEVNRGTETEPQVETATTSKMITCSDETFDINYAIAQREAVGEIMIEDIPDPPPTREDKIEAQITYTAMLTDTMLPEEDVDDV